MQNRHESKEESEDQSIKERIKAAIESKGMKIKQFARESGMAYPSLRDYYSGLRKPGFDAIASIVSFTGVSADWLLIGKGVMFPDREVKLAEVDEGLLGQIAQAVEKEVDAHSERQAGLVAVEDEEDYLYSPTKQARQMRLNAIGKHSVIAAGVYNRVANIGDRKNREEAIKREVATLVRLNRSINAMNIKDEADP